jgi:hypothetical protein
MSWIGAIKFCNWLTVSNGLSDEEMCYVESPNPNAWGPRSNGLIWPSRDLNDDERAQLVANCRGFRLPMDNLGASVGTIPQQENGYNEWYKAFAYDPEGPSSSRLGIYGEVVSSKHWLFGYGRDTVSQGDASFGGYGPTPTGFYDGVNWLPNMVGLTNVNNNAFGAFDGSGNVSEFVQDIAFVAFGSYRGVRGGAYNRGGIELTNTGRWYQYYSDCLGGVGLRVVRVP